jgi:hypothetical protein
MDIEEFKRKINPKGKSSKLDPYRIQIFDLKQTGYTNQQICEWLETIGEKITKDGLRKFIVSRQKQIPKKDFSQTKSNDKKLIQQKNLTPEKEPETFGSHDPRSLDQIFATQHDLEALSRIAKKKKE